jgi:hypothetical protein
MSFRAEDVGRTFLQIFDFYLQIHMAFNAEDGSSFFLRIFGMYLQAHTGYKPEDQHRNIYRRENLKV